MLLLLHLGMCVQMQSSAMRLSAHANLLLQKIVSAETIFLVCHAFMSSANQTISFVMYACLSFAGPLLQQSVEDLEDNLRVRVVSHFCLAKHLIPVLKQGPESSYTFITGAAGTCIA